MNRIRLSTCSVLLAISIPMMCGCGDARRQRFEGTVTFEGRPIENGYIRLIPQQGTPGPTAGANIENGRFSIAAEGGPFAGTFRVEITAMRAGKRKALDPETNQLTAVPQQYIPAKFNSKSELVATIVEGQSRPCEFALHSR
jgi:hypothetical protein